jgi:hypothetical protein
VTRDEGKSTVRHKGLFAGVFGQNQQAEQLDRAYYSSRSKKFKDPNLQNSLSGDVDMISNEK